MKNGRAIIASSMLLCLTAFAEPIGDRGGYAGASYGLTTLADSEFSASGEPDDAAFIDASYDESGQAWQIYAGYRLLRYLAIEARYTDFGDYSADIAGQIFGVDISGDSSAEYAAFSAHALGIYPFGGSGFDIYGQLGIGMASYRNKIRTNVVRVEADDSPVVWSAGLGARYTIAGLPALTVLLGYDWYTFEIDILNESYNQTMGMGKLGLQYNF